MTVKRKRTSNYQDEDSENLPNCSMSTGTTNIKKIRGRARGENLVAGNVTTPDIQPTAVSGNQELFEDVTPSGQSPRRTRNRKVKVEVLINIPVKRRTRSSHPTILRPAPPYSPQALSTSPPSLPQMPSPSSNSTDTSSALPEHLDFSLRLQKRAIFRSLRSSKQQTFNAEPSVNDIATQQLADLVDGTMTRAEGNSCLLLGPRSSGKSKMVEICIDNLLTKPIILRLSGWVQTTDRHALREIAFQLLQQTGSSLLSDLDLSNVAATGSSHEEENPFLVTQGAQPIFDGSILSLPPSSHLHSLIPALLTVNRPVVVILDAFDLFALHPRQSLLYCLLDTVQNCRASAESRGIAVIGMTSRVDTIQLLEKRVKSRFSGRTIRTASHSSFESYLTFVRSSLTATTHGKDTDLAEEWHKRWASSVEFFLTDKAVLDIFKETFNLSRDLKLINRILMACVLQLTPEQPYLTYNHVAIATAAQQSRSSYLSFPALSYPSTCLLIASVHADTSGHPVFTFEMLFESFRDQVRSSMSAPVQVNGGSIGMVRCTREVLMSAFEVLSAAKIFMPVAGTSSSVAREFMKHRCTLDRDTVKKVVEQSGQVNLRKWFSKAQQS